MQNRHEAVLKDITKLFFLKHIDIGYMISYRENKSFKYNMIRKENKGNVAGIEILCCI